MTLLAVALARLDMIDQVACGHVVPSANDGDLRIPAERVRATPYDTAAHLRLAYEAILDGPVAPLDDGWRADKVVIGRRGPTLKLLL